MLPSLAQLATGCYATPIHTRSADVPPALEAKITAEWEKLFDSDNEEDPSLAFAQLHQTFEFIVTPEVLADVIGLSGPGRQESISNLEYYKSRLSKLRATDKYNDGFVRAVAVVRLKKHLIAPMVE